LTKGEISGIKYVETKMKNHLKQQQEKSGFLLGNFQAPVMAFPIGLRREILSVVPGERGLPYLRRRNN